MASRYHAPKAALLDGTMVRRVTHSLDYAVQVTDTLTQRNLAMEVGHCTDCQHDDH